MASKKAKKTPNQIAWEKQNKRLQRIYRDLIKQGFVFGADFQVKQPTPTRITAKKIREIKAIKPETIRKQAIVKPSWYGPKRKNPPKAPQNLPRLSTLVLANVEKMIALWDVDDWFGNYTNYFKNVKLNDKKILNNILQGAIRAEGREEVARRLEAHATEINDIVNFVLYGSGGKSGRSETQFRLVRFAVIVKGEKLSPLENEALTRGQELMQGAD